MTLTEARRKFDTLRADGSKVIVRRHAWADYPKRNFSPAEIRALIAGSGVLRDNRVANPAPDSFVWHCKDDDGQACELAVVFETNEANELVIVISAYRET